ncbi:nicotinate-nucleotide diphosphorylase (carboxylating) [Candidatus Methylacidiphilum fumarolicum]|uniref:nicotinate-nucleotide diphosphorylase (carboxylating) n=2 Tax=Candidatus Methylacidiphilum fumarolicum TaxID=591154 RepID=A0ABM9IGM2_9BACT|nr:carboxylating nicotinate-nucleotide diphosphorylase [Candidatus Methylacidiphilum fumarolicum]TFE70307.1 nicotinate-nucleotide diphosphorylase (carboxylating) [Candidatus Methylacidiphilum fumarolicum]TFE74004.1 nicotinate-nucleotide diphosphorylase (carboxylating) [Candidatus Methylacidiphilum fumarolicum]TFE74511.1 nicotinate-nucleotide diphosphorylase (carboxylating) [Candidatus Methylacidiphilum fumarolicum]TFE77819.1 nicotinate-nucleotide diphosphorylase (carboxylating) [Candidatus Meth
MENKNFPSYSIPDFLLREVIKRSLEEDIGNGDLTSSLFIPRNEKAKAHIIVREEAVLSGLEVACQVFSYIDPSLRCVSLFMDGQKVEKNTPIIEISGNAQTLLMGERVALNFLSHLCGIATLTYRFVEVLRESKTKILDTRKTLPGLRFLQKYAVLCGGGANHRYSLSDHILIKDNHLSLIRRKMGESWLEWLQEKITIIRQHKPLVRIEIETKTLEELSCICTLSPDIIMLDNMELNQISEGMKIINHKALVEVSGRVNLEKLQAVARLGVDFVSLGLLTHSAQAVDVSMDIL